MKAIVPEGSDGQGHGAQVAPRRAQLGDLELEVDLRLGLNHAYLNPNRKSEHCSEELEEITNRSAPDCYLLRDVVSLVLHEPQGDLCPGRLGDLLLQLRPHLLHGLPQVPDEYASVAEPPDIHGEERVVPETALELHAQIRPKFSTQQPMCQSDQSRQIKDPSFIRQAVL
jgi:hypothetical protein